MVEAAGVEPASLSHRLSLLVHKLGLLFYVVANSTFNFIYLPPNTQRTAVCEYE